MDRPALPPDLRRALEASVGSDHVVVDPDLLVAHERDWTGRFGGATPALVRPADTAQVAAVLAACTRAGVAVVPQGGNTGLVGGSVPRRGEVVVHLGRLQRLDVDAHAGRVVAGAGVTVARVQEAAAAAGWSYGVDLASRDSATVGGTVATNAGGIHVLRHGPTRSQVLGVEAVLADGRVVSHLGGLVKDNTGYDLAGLVCGSEGTLAVVTAACLRLVPALPVRTVALAGFADAPRAIRAAGRWRRAVSDLVAEELFFDDGLSLVCEQFGLPRPLRATHDAYVLVEAAAADDPTERLAEAVGADPEVGEVAVATDAGGAERLWRYREAHTEAINALGPPHKLDVTLPESALPAFVREVRDAVAHLAPDARTWLFGHVGDGNVHVNVTGLAPEDDRVDGAVLELVAAHGGSISAEHGIGVAKLDWLHLNRSPEELAVFRAVKGALDPDGTLNPGVLVPPG
jgi:FAD/FMN-containing dehydrogenase